MKGKVQIKLGSDISTDIIYPGRFMATVLPTETPAYAFADETEINKKLTNGQISKGSFVVADDNFGCGSSREQAASTLKGYDLIVVAKNFSRIFMQNAINLGLKTVICPDIKAKEGDELEISGEILKNNTTGVHFKIVSLPKARQAIIDAGGLIPFTRKKLVEERGKR